MVRRKLVSVRQIELDINQPVKLADFKDALQLSAWCYQYDKFFFYGRELSLHADKKGKTGAVYKDKLSKIQDQRFIPAHRLQIIQGPMVLFFKSVYCGKIEISGSLDNKPRVDTGCTHAKRRRRFRNVSQFFYAFPYSQDLKSCDFSTWRQILYLPVNLSGHGKMYEYVRW